MKVRVAGVWKSPTPYVKVAGVWKPYQQAYVKVSGTWRRFYRKPDLLYNANVLLESYVWVDQNTYYTVQVDASGNVALGSTTNKYTTEGYTIANIQAGEATSNGYPGRRWLSVMYRGNVPNRDMDTITYAGQTSVARTVNGTYAAVPFDVTRYDYGFASAIPVGSVQNIYF